MLNVTQIVPLTLQPTAQFDGYLTPDALMAYCENRLQGIDSQVQAAFDQQEQANDDSTKLTNLANSIQVPSGDLDLNTETGYQQAWDTYQSMVNTANSLSNPQTKQDLLNAASALKNELTSALTDMTGWKWSEPPFQNDQQIQAFFGGQTVQIGKISFSKGNKTSETISTASFQSNVTDAIKGVQSDVSNSAELQMISLQSLMSQRQEAIQICTNLVQSLGDQVNKIADNVGH